MIIGYCADLRGCHTMQSSGSSGFLHRQSLSLILKMNPELLFQ